MILEAKRKSKKGAFISDDFMCSDRSTAWAGSYDCILFNGSLQFFGDPLAVLRKAQSLLNPGGRVVVAHANGASFVDEERRRNPSVVLSAMPSSNWLASEPPKCSLQLVPNRSEPPFEIYLAVLKYIVPASTPALSD